MTAGQLMLEFESVGDNCEFGITQRYCGVDPLGLFRFSFSRLSSLQDVFDAGFPAYGEEDDLAFVIAPGDGELTYSSRRYDDFSTHTETYATKTTIEKVRAREAKKLRYLKDRLLADLASGEKIFVRKRNDSEPEEDIAAFAAILRRHGPNILLWVVLCDADHPEGTVEIIGEGLLKGYIRRFASYGNALDVDMEAWIAVCLKAFGLARRMKGFEEGPPRLARNPIAARGSDWQAASQGRVEAGTVDVPPLETGSSVSRVTLLDKASDHSWLALTRIDGPFDVGALLVFCTWVWIPRLCEATAVVVSFAHMPVHFTGRADLSKRDVWQRVWSGVKVKEASTAVHGILCADGEAGAVLYCTDWELQLGSIPNRVSDAG